MWGRSSAGALLLAVACSGGTLGDGAESLGETAGTSGSTGIAHTTTPVTSSSETSTSSGSATTAMTSTEATTSVESSSGTGSSSGDIELGSSSSTSGGQLPVLASCSDLLAFDGELEDGLYLIDPDGPGEITGLEVYCDMTRDGGGWTLVMVSSDDGQNTWTWADQTLFTTNETSVGSVDQIARDYKSIAFHRVPFSGLMFAHQPSEVWAAYDLASGGLDLGTYMEGLPSPICDAALPGNGVPMTAGTLTVVGALCDTDLYFHLGDWDGADTAACTNQTRTGNNPTFGPAWSRSANGSCPFDDPVNSALGPSAPCVGCVKGEESLERAAVGYGSAAGFNTGTPGAAQNYIQVFVR